MSTVERRGDYKWLGGQEETSGQRRAKSKKLGYGSSNGHIKDLNLFPGVTVHSAGTHMCPMCHLLRSQTSHELLCEESFSSAGNSTVRRQAEGEQGQTAVLRAGPVLSKSGAPVSAFPGPSLFHLPAHEAAL